MRIGKPLGRLWISEAAIGLYPVTLKVSKCYLHPPKNIHVNARRSNAKANIKIQLLGRSAMALVRSQKGDL